jgi:tetratricopeptide (TPR) repeat protein
MEQARDAMLMIRLERYEEAEETLRRLRRVAEQQRDGQALSLAYEGLGVIAARRGRDVHAVELLERALESASPADPAARFELYTELALLYASTGRAERAVSLLEGCLAELSERGGDPAQVVVYTVYLSNALADAGRYGEASAALVEALRVGAEDIDREVRGHAYFSLSRLYAATGETAQALAYAAQALEMLEDASDSHRVANAHLQNAHILLDAGEPQRAGPHLEAAATLYGPRPSAIDLGFLRVEEARRALQLGDTDLASELAGEAVAMLGNAAIPGQLGDAYLVLARCYDEAGDEEQAEFAYTAAIDGLRRQNGWHCELGRAYRWYGKFLRRQGRAEAALEALEQAADLAPSNQVVVRPRLRSGA